MDTYAHMLSPLRDGFAMGIYLCGAAFILLVTTIVVGGKRQQK